MNTYLDDCFEQHVIHRRGGLRLKLKVPVCVCKPTDSHTSANTTTNQQCPNRRHSAITNE